ncbi:MAG: recombination mediator RecR [Firmicutes bacterium]|nr:recombination mediator RecR [Bacillota bacterium]MCL2771331.1 recombination mediator RecR [Bacillota bacterium]
MDIIEKLINEFSKLPGVGRKNAIKYAYKIIAMEETEAKDFANTILEVKEKITFCTTCGNFTDVSPCALCVRVKNQKQICVIAEPKDIIFAKRIKDFEGGFHILHGTLSPLEGRGPNDIKIKELLVRVAEGSEVVIATNTDVEGEATAMYIAKILKPLGVKVTRLAQGISMGTDLEYADEVTLNHAFNQRKEI